jgi:hypothetical protein
MSWFLAGTLAHPDEKSGRAKLPATKTHAKKFLGHKEKKEKKTSCSAACTYQNHQ